MAFIFIRYIFISTFCIVYTIVSLLCSSHFSYGIPSFIYYIYSITLLIHILHMFIRYTYLCLALLYERYYLPLLINQPQNSEVHQPILFLDIHQASEYRVRFPYHFKNQIHSCIPVILMLPDLLTHLFITFINIIHYFFYSMYQQRSYEFLWPISPLIIYQTSDLLARLSFH